MHDSVGKVARGGQREPQDAVTCRNVSRYGDGFRDDLRAHHEVARSKHAQAVLQDQRADRNRSAPQSYAHRTIQAELPLPGKGGALWKREDTQIHFTPWDWENRGAGEVESTRVDFSRPLLVHYDTEPLYQADLLETSAESHDTAPRQISGGAHVQFNNSRQLTADKTSANTCLPRRANAETHLSGRAVRGGGRGGERAGGYDFYPRRRRRRLETNFEIW